MCTGTEVCSAATNSCVSGAPLTCNDNDACCDGLEEKRWPTGFVSTSAACTLQWSGRFGYCSGASGWSGASPACGGTGTYSSCSLITGCTRSVNTSAKQECR